MVSNNRAANSQGADLQESARKVPATCPRCDQPVDPLDASYLRGGQPAHIICPPAPTGPSGGMPKKEQA